MELLVHTVKEYLEHNKRIVVPRLGTFIVKPDGQTIVFSELLRDDDGVLRSLLTTKGLSELEIDGMIDRMIFNIRHAVSGGKDYAIDNFGTFTAGANGTIRFASAKHKSVIHGYIKPAIPLSDNIDRREAKAPITTMYDKQGEHEVKMSRSHIANPDPYLRGLKYDKHKKSEREGTVYVMSGGKQSRSHNMLIALIAAIAVICAASYVFMRFHDNPPEQELTAGDDPYIEQDDASYMEVVDPEAEGETDDAAGRDTAQQGDTGQTDDTTPPAPTSENK